MSRLALLIFVLSPAPAADAGVPEKKLAPNRLMVDEAVQDDNSVVALHPETMEKLELFRGDTVLLKGKRRKDTVCIVLADENVAPNKVRMNKVLLLPPHASLTLAFDLRNTFLLYY